MIFIFFLVLIIIFVGMKRGQGNEILNKNTTQSIKGICAIIIAINHMSTYYLYPNYLLWVSRVSYLAVAIFFFYSGYGLMFNYNKKKDYLKNFMRIRVSKVYIPFIISNLSYVLYLYMWGKIENNEKLLKYILGLNLVNSQSWYVISIIGFYCCFYVVFNITQNKNIAIVLIFTYDIIYTFLCIYFRAGVWWYISSIAFIMGICFETYKDKIVCYLNKKYHIYLLCNSLIFGLLFIAMNVFPTRTSYRIVNINYFIVGLQLLTVPAFVILFILISMRIVTSNKISHFLGEISYELYLIHGVVIWMFKSDLAIFHFNGLMYITLCLVSSIILAVGLKRISSKLTSFASTPRCL